MSFRREKGIARGGPNGGNGSRGGSVFLVTDENLNTLSMARSKVHYKGKDGSNGQGKARHAKNPPDVSVFVPPGTVVRTDQGILIGQLSQHGEKLLVARGGRGGRGNLAFKTERQNAPKFMENGELGAERWITLELKLVGDVGLVGIPNAGKSSLLRSVSNAKPKVADYPFTTVTPNLGVWDGGDLSQKGLVIADIPGLLEGAHAGVGMGLAFLRHVERCRVLIHVISGSSEDPVGDYRAIQQELELFRPALLEKPQVVVLNKIDLPDVAERQDELLKALKAEMGHKRIMPISAVKSTNTQELMARVRKLIESIPEDSIKDPLEGEEAVPVDPEDDSDEITILSDPSYPGQWRVIGPKLERLARMTNWDYYEAVIRFQRIMEAMGIDDALKREGAEPGDLIMIDEFDFEYRDKFDSNAWVTDVKEG